MISTNFVFDSSQYGFHDILVFAFSVILLVMLRTEEKISISPHSRTAYKCISEGDLEGLKKHTLWVSGDKATFKKLPYPNQTMLISAAYHSQLDVAKFLVEEAKVDINEKLKSGETALFRACYFNRVEIVQYLLEKGADPNGDFKN